MSELALEVKGVTKTYGSVRAVNDLSFTVGSGEIFGLLGPNGAGKTSTIRMILDIIKPNAGEINVLGGPMSRAKKPRIGYLPEERGLYNDMTLFDTLVFMARLKQLPRDRAREKVAAYLHKVELWDVRERKIEQLSRGMNQKAQFLAAVLHEPELIIIDEPFTALDPVNTRMIKDLLYELRANGATIIMSTHQMNRVEEMCERILLMDHGDRVLYGPLDEIRRQFTANAVEVGLQGHVDHVKGAARITQQNGTPPMDGATSQDGATYRMVLEEGVEPQQVLKTLVEMPGVRVDRFERVEASLDDIFVRVVGHEVETTEAKP